MFSNQLLKFIGLFYRNTFQILIKEIIEFYFELDIVHFIFTFISVNCDFSR